MLNAESGRQTGLRQSNIELLRIIAMIIIVANHFAVHGGFEFSTDTISINRLWIQFIQIGGKIGVNIFVLISGYFLISIQGINIKKAVKLWLQIFSYSILIFVVFTYTGLEPFGINELIEHCFPLIFSQWWFASTYFILYLASPYINMLLKAFNKDQYVRFLLLFGIFWCIIPTFTGQAFQSNDLLWFIYVYSFAAYWKLFGCTDRFTGKTYIMLSIFLTLLTFASVVAFDILGTKIPFFGAHATFFYHTQRLPIFSISILLFIGFSKIDVGYSRFINVLSSAMFDVYLLHNSLYTSKFLWETVFSNASYAESNILIPYSLFAIAVVFMGCTLIGLARIYIFEKYCMPIIDIISDLVVRVRNFIFHIFQPKK